MYFVYFRDIINFIKVDRIMLVSNEHGGKWAVPLWLICYAVITLPAILSVAVLEKIFGTF